MATKRAPTRAPARARVAGVPEPEPTDTEGLALELASALESWRAAAHLARIAREGETEARTVLVDVLHRCGLKGFSL